MHRLLQTSSARAGATAPAVSSAAGGWAALATAATVVALVTAPALSGCGARPSAEGYFPLAAGHRWEYDQRIEWENHTIEHEPLVLSTEGRESPEGLDGGPAWRRRSASGVDYWLRSDATGIWRVASKTDVEEQARADPAPRYVLKAPYAVGTTWQATTTSYLLQRKASFPREVRHGQEPVTMTYRIEAAGMAVQVPAGRFDGCLQVRGEAPLRLFADPVQGWRDLPLVTLEWYCPGVGLVKLQREERAGSAFLSGGVLTMELEHWR